VLGAVLERTNVVAMPSVLQALTKVLPERYHHLLPLNEQALRRGMELAAEKQPA
jgi:2-oxoglutarate ferredoxin oxidoreductase subunit gamma